MKLNFTGKNKLTDEEFISFYDELWSRTPHYSINWPSIFEIERKKAEGEDFYNSDTFCANEEWKELPGYSAYSVSSMGRIKFHGKLVEQDDKYPDKMGYLVLAPKNSSIKVNKTREVYTFVAMTFMGKVEGDGYHVHHIDNNGYNCSTENLILLTAKQHKAVHLDEHMNLFELTSFLREEYSEERIKNHLSNYKLNVLGIEECGEWQNHLKYSHILPGGLDIKNLILNSYPNEFEELYKSKEKSLHKYFAHLSSSQALCFNLFYPMSITNRLNLIDSKISKNAKSDFEHVEQDSFEKASNDKEKTNFDFFIDDQGNKYFFELKYTEQAFGSVADIKDGDKHDQKYQNYYRQQLSKISNTAITRKEFFDDYQIWRNICHADMGTVYFVFLKTRTSLKNEIDKVLVKCKDEYKRKIKILYIENLVRDCLKEKEDDLFYQHYQEFYSKYLKNI